MHTPLMQCGHTAQGTDSQGNKVCVICYPDPKSYMVDRTERGLSGRKAHCAYNHMEDKPTDAKHPFDPVTSDASGKLAFFEYRGEGSRDAVEKCKHCWYAVQAHAGPMLGDHLKKRSESGITDHEFESHGAYEYDLYYCGCRGWD